MRKKILSAVGRKNQNYLWKPTPRRMEKRERKKWLVSLTGVLPKWAAPQSKALALQPVIGFRYCFCACRCHHQRAPTYPLCCGPHLIMAIINNSTSPLGWGNRMSWNVLLEWKRQQQNLLQMNLQSLSIASCQSCFGKLQIDLIKLCE